ncbi:helix-turn-helix domain containing protein [Myxococcota bacterium]|nr:helix-turn-helix domain containing protein [Myxococcota bacterium]MBU1432061.1 helix-turn-helix domain containing protein [Myxococcota bacterium]MBU1897934.1 helix-turn-helix domain containing protein [Myxococcota bacterium]
MQPERENDLLERVLEMERQGADLTAYCAALRRLADALETPEHGPALRDAFIVYLSGVAPTSPNDLWAEARWDALVDLISEVPRFAALLRAIADRAAARGQGAVNLLSMLNARVLWRARDNLRQRRALRRRSLSSNETHGACHPQSRFIAQLILERVEARFCQDPEQARVLSLLLEGRTVSEVSRMTGQSRQAIYRWFGRIREWLSR